MIPALSKAVSPSSEERAGIIEKKERLCPTSDCGLPSMPDRRACYRCHKRAYRAAHPERDKLHLLRHHAKDRGIEVDLDFAEWLSFCQQTGYVHRCGLWAGSLTVDRHNAEEGYYFANLRPLPRSENSRKWWEQDRPRRMERRAA